MYLEEKKLDREKKRESKKNHKFLKFHIFQLSSGKWNAETAIMFSCPFITSRITHKFDAKGRTIKPNEKYWVLPYCIALKCHKIFYKDKFPLKCSNTVRVENKTIFILYTSYPQRKNTKRSSDVFHNRQKPSRGEISSLVLGQGRIGKQFEE